MSVMGKAATYAFVKEYIAHQLFNDLPKAALKAYKRIDADDLLHKAGLARHRPAAAAASGTGLFILGAALGGFAALLLAPKVGAEMRTSVKSRALGWIDPAKKQYGSETAQA